MDRIYGILFGLTGTTIFLFIRWYALKTGVAPAKADAISRKKNPAIFRAAIIMYTVLAGLFAMGAIGYLVGILPPQP